MRARGVRWTHKNIAAETGLSNEQVLAVFHKTLNVLVEGRADHIDIDGFGDMRIHTISPRAFSTTEGMRAARSHSYLRLRQTKRVREFLHVKTPGITYASPNTDLMNQAWLSRRGMLPGGGNRHHRKQAADAAAAAKNAEPVSPQKAAMQAKAAAARAAKFATKEEA